MKWRYLEAKRGEHLQIEGKRKRENIIQTKYDNKIRAKRESIDREKKYKNH